MRKIIFSAIVISIMGLAGCATPTLPSLTQPFRAWVKTWDIEVVSDPGGADAYVNGAFIGKTPALTQLRVYYNTLGIPEEQPPKVLVAKQGYQTEGTSLGIPGTYPSYEKTTIKFTLAKEGSPERGHVGAAEAHETVNIRVDADLTEGVKKTTNTINKRDWQENKPDLNLGSVSLKEFIDSPLKTKKEESPQESKESQPRAEDIYSLVRSIKTFEYEGHTYQPLFTDSKRILKGDKAVFCANFTKEGEYTLIHTKEGKDVPLNMEIFTIEIIDNIPHFKRVTKTKDKYEMVPLWTEDGNIAYADVNIKNHANLKCHLDGKIEVKDAEARFYIISPEGNILGEITSGEYGALKNK